MHALICIDVQNKHLHLSFGPFRSINLKGYILLTNWGISVCLTLFFAYCIVTMIHSVFQRNQRKCSVECKDIWTHWVVQMCGWCCLVYSIKAGNDIDMSRQSTQRNLDRNVWDNSKMLTEADLLALPPSQKGKQLANHDTCTLFPLCVVAGI